jgi:hypothetical protein
MKKILVTSIIVLALLILAAVPASAAGGKDYTKVFVIPLTVSEKAVTPGDVVLEYGYGPKLGLQSGTFRGELADTKGNTITSFTLWDPRIRFGDSMVLKPDGTVSKVSGILEKMDSAELTVVVPFSKNSGAFNLYNNKSRVSTVDLTPVIRKFCAANPGDPDCDTTAAALPIIIGAGVVILVLCAGWYILKKKKGGSP